MVISFWGVESAFETRFCVLKLFFVDVFFFFFDDCFFVLCVCVCLIEWFFTCFFCVFFLSRVVV